jgi:peptidoglycan/xylan/chitin deacetylase (PgdA/CDA1 family)
MVCMKTLALKVLQNCGTFALARTMSANGGRILAYHNFSDHSETRPNEVSISAARVQLEYLRRHFRVVPLSLLVEKLASGAPLDPYSVALTVDDGRRNFYELFFPLLKEFEMPATFFVVSSFIRRDDWVWTDKILWLSEQSKAPGALAPDRIAGFFKTLNRMRPEGRNVHIQDTAQRLGITIPKDPPPKYEPCSWSELREMADSGLVEVGSHTVTHPLLASVTDSEVWQELVTSRSQIEEGLRREVRIFCFPNGKPTDYRPNHLQLVKEAGYNSAVVTRFEMAFSGSDVYELPRMGISAATDILSFSKYLDGVEYYQHKLRSSLLDNSRLDNGHYSDEAVPVLE